jgi:hypothetical protein
MPGTTLNDLDIMDIETLFPYIHYIINKDNIEKREALPDWYKDYKEAVEDTGN